MGIRLENIKLKKEDNLIFENLNIIIPYKKIIGLFGDKKEEFVHLLKTKDFNTGKLIDDEDYLDNILLIDTYDDFITNYVLDELTIKINYSKKMNSELEKILNKIGLDINYLNKSITKLSNLEKKVLQIIIAMYNDSKTIIFNNLFNGISYRNKGLFIKLLKIIKKTFNKTIIVSDNDMDSINNLVDYMLIVDSNLVVIDNNENIYNNENIDKVNIELPNLIKIKNILKNKGIDVENIKNINDLLRK